MILAIFNIGERRKHNRYNTDVKVRYVPANSQEDATEEGIVRDISCGGLKLDTINPINKRAHILVEISLKDLDITFAATGVVRWGKKLNGLTSHGIKFRWISDQEAYKKYIEMLDITEGTY